MVKFSDFEAFLNELTDERDISFIKLGKHWSVDLSPKENFTEEEMKGAYGAGWGDSTISWSEQNDDPDEMIKKFAASMKEKFNRKQRADIYLKSAIMEYDRFGSSIICLNDNLPINDSLEHFYEEATLINKGWNQDGLNQDQVQSIRILALLFAHQMALNP